MASNEPTLNIDEAAERMSYSSAYVRTLIRDGKLTSTMVPLSEGSQVRRHMLTPEDCDAYMATAPRRNIRKDGRNKYIMYATPPEFKESIRVLKAAGRTTHAVAELIVPANIRKPED